MAKPEMFAKLPQWFNLDQSAHMEEPVETKLTGIIPKWISGSLYRNGSGLYKLGESSWKHLFDGFAVLQRWTIQDGKVTYLSSILDSEVYKTCVKKNRIYGLSFGSNFPDPCMTIFQRLFHAFVPDHKSRRDNTAVNIVEFGDRLFALTETPFINEIKPESLMVEKGKLTMPNVIAIHFGTAHPHLLKDGTMVYFGTNMNHKQAYNFVLVPRQPADSESPFAEAKILASAPSRWKMNISYTHSFGLTKNYIIQLEQPVAINLPRLATMNFTGSSIADCILPYKEESMDLLVISRETGKVTPITYKGPNGFVFHFINSYEEKNHVICDVCFYKDGTDAIVKLYLESMANDGNGINCNDSEACFARFVLPIDIDQAEEGKNLITLPNTSATAYLDKGSRNVVCVQPEYIAGSPGVELPRYNEEFTGVKYRYFYAMGDSSKDVPQITKFDLEQKTWISLEVGRDYKAGEPVFLPKPGATEEDDGIVLCTMIACNSTVPSYLVVVDAKSFTELGRAELPQDIKINLTFHGNFTKHTF